MRNWFTAKAAHNRSADVAIYDEVGMWGVSARDFRDALKELGEVEQINLSINSPGGSVFDGVAIHNMLARHKAKVVVTVDGLAASIASVIAMAGDEIVMPANAMMMIHNPAGVVVGQSKDMREMAEALDKVRDAIAASYMRRTKMERQAVNALLDAETWLTADEAVEMGFADRTTEPAHMAASFDLSKFKHPPTSCSPATTETKMTMRDPDHPQEAVAPAPQTSPQPASPRPIAAEPRPAEGAQDLTQQPDMRGQECADIVAACDLAGQPGRALEFIGSRKCLREVVAELRNSRPSAAGGAPRGMEVSARHDVTAGGGQEPAMRVDIVAGMKKQFGVA